MIDAVLLAVDDPSSAERVTSLVEGVVIVSLPPECPPGDIVALATQVCGRRPERPLLAADGARGGELTTAALTGWLPVAAVAVAPRFAAMPLQVRARFPLALAPMDGDGRVLAERLVAAGHPVIVVEGDVVDAVEALLSRGL
ncbi:MAG TPA: hypothetical protein VLD62_04725 [Acidimicrobiia bacterium]|nr:hypothetical protein [Acidimicrobiia bacterium]